MSDINRYLPLGFIVGENRTGEISINFKKTLISKEKVKWLLKN